MFGLKRFRIRSRYHDIVRTRLQRTFRDIDQIIVQQQFTTSPKNFILLCEINWKERFGDFDDRLSELKNDVDVFDDITVINSDQEQKRTLCFLMGVHDPIYTELFIYTTQEFLCFIEFPIFLREEYGIMNLVGVPEDVDRLLAFMKEFGSGFEIMAVMNYSTRDRGLLASLTEKQLSVMKYAYEHGFFEHPRKTSARELANKLEIAHTTFLTHIRKSQQRILSVLFDV